VISVTGNLIMAMDRIQMMEHARIMGDCNDEQIPIEDFEWSEIDLSVEALLKIMSREKWDEFWLEELDIAKNDLEDIQEPIIIVQKDDGIYSIWDGWHRSAATVVTGRAAIKAIFGRHCTLNDEFKPSAMLR
jgi:hypothetical protein